MDKRPRKEDGSLFISCKSCGVPPDRCKGFCIFQRMTAEAEKLIANAKREVEESLIKSLEQNLKENLAKDTIERMNIPEVLKKLSSIGAKQVTGTSLPE